MEIRSYFTDEKALFMRSYIVLFFVMLMSTSAWAEADLTTTAVEDKSFPQYEVFDTVIEAIHFSTVSSRISAQVIELNYDVNDSVPKGAVIMKFRDAEFQARVAQSRAGLSASKAQYKEAIARQTEASSEAKRVQKLFKRKLQGRHLVNWRRAEWHNLGKQSD